MEFKIADKSEIDQLVEIRMYYLLEDFKTMTKQQQDLIRKQLPEYFEEHIGKDMIPFVALDQGKIVASALLVVINKPANPRFITGKMGEVLNVVTHKDYRRQGIAKQLMEMLLTYAKEADLDFVSLSATQDGYPLYKKIGFNEYTSECTAMVYPIKQI